MTNVHDGVVAALQQTKKIVVTNITVGSPYVIDPQTSGHFFMASGSTITISNPAGIGTITVADGTSLYIPGHFMVPNYTLDMNPSGALRWIAEVTAGTSTVITHVPV